MKTTVLSYVGTGLTIFLTVAGLGVTILGAVLPHWGVALVGVGIAAISGYGVFVSAKQLGWIK